MSTYCKKNLGQGVNIVFISIRDDNWIHTR